LKQSLTVLIGGDPEKVKKSERDRFRDDKIVDEIIEFDAQWRKLRFEVDNLRKELGVVSKAVAKKMKDSKGEDKCEEEKAQANAVKEKIEETEKRMVEVDGERTKRLNTIGNIVDGSVPISKDEEKDNGIAVTWGEIPDLKVDGKTLGHLHHHEIMQILDFVEFERGQKIAGHRGYFLKGYGVLLN
jgi:seryl-tRNA synthetase